MECIKDAPSQASAPPVDLCSVEYPFQKMCGDYMEVGGFHYLVVMVHFSNWPMVY